MDGFSLAAAGSAGESTSMSMSLSTSGSAKNEGPLAAFVLPVGLDGRLDVLLLSRASGLMFRGLTRAVEAGDLAACDAGEGLPFLTLVMLRGDGRGRWRGRIHTGLRTHRLHLKEEQQV